MTDAELLRRLRARETEALASLVDTYAAPVHSLVRRILGLAGTESDIEECVSDVFYKAWLKIETYDPERAPLRTWLLILAKYDALERRRSLTPKGGPALELPLILSAGPTPEQELERAASRAEVQQALNQLLPLDRELVYRRYFLGESVEALAAELGLTRQAADNRLWRARKSLRRILTAEAEGVPIFHG